MRINLINKQIFINKPNIKAILKLVILLLLVFLALNFNPFSGWKDIFNEKKYNEKRQFCRSFSKLDDSLLEKC